MTRLRSSSHSQLHGQVFFFIGTEAEFIKVFPVIIECERRNLRYQVIASGQNNILQSQLWSFLTVKQPSCVLSEKHITPTPLGLLYWWLSTLLASFSKINKLFLQSRREGVEPLVLVHGDTVSTVMGAVLTRLAGGRVAHLEAGLRSFNFFHPFPEEIDRILVSYLAQIHFCPNTWAEKNLRHRAGLKINTEYNTLVESLRFALKVSVKSSVLKRLGNKPYFVFVVHRQENLMNSVFLTMLIGEIESISNRMLCLFVVHPLTELALRKLKLWKQLQQNPRVVMTSRLEYVEMMNILNESEFLITDGGSNQEESYYFGKPCLVLREATERIEGLGENVLLGGQRLTAIRDFVAHYRQYRRPAVQCKEWPSKIIVSTLLKILSTGM